MTNRFWFYLGATIIIVGMLNFLYGERSRQQRQITTIESANYQLQRTSLAQYLSRQTDARKMVSLAKYTAKTNPTMVEPILERAYELNPNSRDIAVLLSAYRPELKKRVLELDPLYKF